MSVHQNALVGGFVDPIGAVLRKYGAQGASSLLIRDFNPRRYIPANSLARLYKASNGVDPVTADADTIGLVLDESQGAALGAELLGTGAPALTGTADAATYDTGTGAGTVHRVDGSNLSSVAFTGLLATAFYLIDLEAVSGAAGVLIRPTSAGTPASVSVAEGVRRQAIVLALGGAFYITTGATNPTTSSFVVHSIRLVAGNHAWQSTAGSRGLIQDVSGRKVWRGDGVDDHLVTGLVPATSMTMVVACTFNSAADFILGCKGAGSDRCQIGVTAGGALGGAVGAQTESSITGGSSILGVPGVAALAFDGSLVRLFWKPFTGAISKLYEAAQSGVPTTSVAIALGARNLNDTFNAFTNGDMYGGFLTQAALTDSEIAAVANAMARG